jgi:hypothetical protein
VTDNPVLRHALAYANRGWPVFPCKPGSKAPDTLHGHLEATTDPARIHAWFANRPDRNLAIATGAPGPDVLDVDCHGPDRNGFAALRELRKAGHLDGVSASVQTPSGGMHFYFLGSDQRCGQLPAHHIDFRSQGGYVVAPPTQVDRRPNLPLKAIGGDTRLDWKAAAAYLSPGRSPLPARPSPGPEYESSRDQVSALARWLAKQPEGNRNNGLYWAAKRALERDPAADLSPLAAAARQAGLDEPEMTKTISSAMNPSTTASAYTPHDRELEGER